MAFLSLIQLFQNLYATFLRVVRVWTLPIVQRTRWAVPAFHVQGHKDSHSKKYKECLSVAGDTTEVSAMIDI